MLTQADPQLLTLCWLMAGNIYLSLSLGGCLSPTEAKLERGQLPDSDKQTFPWPGVRSITGVSGWTLLIILQVSSLKRWAEGKPWLWHYAYSNVPTHYFLCICILLKLNTWVALSSVIVKSWYLTNKLSHSSAFQYQRLWSILTKSMHFNQV